MGRGKIAVAGLVAGLIAALLMTLVMIALRAGLGISPPPESIPDRLAPTIPVGAFLPLLSRVGGYNRLKQLGIGGGLLGQLIVGALGGMFFARVTETETASKMVGVRRFGLSGRDALVVAPLVGVAWVITLGLLWPVRGANYRGLAPGSALLANALGLLFAYASYGLALTVVYRLITGSDPVRQVESDAGVPFGRRVAITGVAGAALALAGGGFLRLLVGRATFGYDGTRYQGADIQPLTPNERFYVVTKNVFDPAVARDSWSLEITGLVERRTTYSFAELTALPATTQETTLRCISNGVGDGLLSNATWKGVPLRQLLAAAGPRAGIVEVKLHGADGYTDTFALAKALEPTTLVAYEMNGAALPERHGYPARVIVPGLYGEKHVKWVTRIELVDHDAQGFYEQQGWGPNFAVATSSRIDMPDFAQPVRVGTPITLKGVAFAGDRGVSRVEVSTDDGRTWREARRDYPGTRLTWALWSYAWRPANPGEYKLAVRATDGTGAVQTAEERGVAPEGATGYHRVTARVEA